MSNPNETPVRVFADQQVQAPAVCCCCLAPKEEDVNEKLYISAREFVLIPVPWCKACRGKRTRSTLVLVLLMFSAGALGVVVPIVAFGAGDLGYGLGTLGGIIGLIVGAVIAVKLRKGFAAAGHIPGCDAVGSLQVDALDPQGRRGGHFRFGNAEFARLWQQQNP